MNRASALLDKAVTEKSGDLSDVFRAAYDALMKKHKKDFEESIEAEFYPAKKVLLPASISMQNPEVTLDIDSVKWLADEPYWFSLTLRMIFDGKNINVQFEYQDDNKFSKKISGLLL